MRRTKEDAEKTRLKIIEAALTLFSRNGYSNTTLGMIGAEAGYSRGPIYWHSRIRMICIRLYWRIPRSRWKT